MNSPFLSIITVCLNPGKALSETVASVDSQSFGDFEHLIKDGGSSDGSLASVPLTGRRRLVIEPDGGIYEAMNDAVKLASGDYINFLNAGDRYPDGEILEKVSDAIVDSGFPDLLYGDFFDERSGKLRHSADPLSRRSLFLGGVCHQAQWIRRDVFLKMGGLDLSYRFRADQELLLRLVEEARPTKRIADVLALYDGRGFTAKPENRCRLDAEWDRLRRTRFTAIERARWGAAAALRGRWLKRILLDLAMRHAPGLLQKRRERIK